MTQGRTNGESEDCPEVVTRVLVVGREAENPNPFLSQNRPLGQRPIEER